MQKQKGPSKGTKPDQFYPMCLNKFAEAHCPKTAKTTQSVHSSLPGVTYRLNDQAKTMGQKNKLSIFVFRLDVLDIVSQFGRLYRLDICSPFLTCPGDEL